MITAMVISGTLTMAILIAILYGVGDLGLALNRPTKYPIMQMLLTATGSKAATTALSCALMTPLFFSVLGFQACASRLAWAFARDHGLPFSAYFAHVSKLPDYCT